MTRKNLFVAVTALSLLATPVIAAPGGNGGSNGNGGNSASAGSQGHGAATSTAAKDPDTKGLEKALSVVGTTPASPNAIAAIQSALDRFLARNVDDAETESEPEEIIETVE